MVLIVNTRCESIGNYLLEEMDFKGLRLRWGVKRRCFFFVFYNFDINGDYWILFFFWCFIGLIIVFLD
jgi:hypothetical protein